jgi:glutaminyl-tRNA synthetase
MYDFAHAVSDAIEGITHSLCTLEFADHRPLYDWTIENLKHSKKQTQEDDDDEGQAPSSSDTSDSTSSQGLSSDTQFFHLDQQPPSPFAFKHLYGGTPAERPRQTEFSRLNLQYTVLSKRKLIQLVQGGNEKGEQQQQQQRQQCQISGWDDPRMPTLAGIRRRGFPPEALRLFCERVGISKTDSAIDMSVLEDCARVTLDPMAPRCLAVLKPVKFVITNWPKQSQPQSKGQEQGQGLGGFVETFVVPAHPRQERKGGGGEEASSSPYFSPRQVSMSGEVFIDADDFMLEPSKGFNRLVPGGKVRQKRKKKHTHDDLGH